MVHYVKIHQCNPLYEQTQRKKIHTHLIIYWKITEQNTTPFHVKILESSENQGPYINIIKAIYSKQVANIKLNGEKHEEIALKSGTKQAVTFSLSIQYSSWRFIQRNWTTKESQRKTIWKGRNHKITLFANDILYLNDHKNSSENSLVDNLL